MYFVKQKSPKKSCIFPHHRRGEFLPFFHERMLHPVALAFEYEQVPVVRQTVNHRRGHLVIGEDGPPFGELQIGRNNQTAALVAVGNDTEEQLRAVLVNGV